MKKTLFIAIIVLLACNLQAQDFRIDTINTFTQKVTTQLNGFVDNYGVMEESDAEYAFIAIPEVFDFDVVRAMLSLLPIEYDNVEVMQAWRRSGTYFQTIWAIDGQYVGIVYYPDSFQVGILLPAEENQ